MSPKQIILSTDFSECLILQQSYIGEKDLIFNLTDSDNGSPKSAVDARTDHVAFRQSVEITNTSEWLLENLNATNSVEGVIKLTDTLAWEASLITILPSEKWSTLIGKYLLPVVASSFPFRVDITKTCLFK